ncbi:FAD-binding domain-containing protein [Coniochaeta ligniaria NRRL 30616]|uniref:FAD-binding domain-containing protein n=1 Tax=Coniochaeta ligniaria NRRL 30616 TaxID=1408157 RepID=A0A1J7JS30_9PEZI|nr:FAD-binding domain-containing protein [Coniochaeta ligniaria NRRL 30616]
MTSPRSVFSTLGSSLPGITVLTPSSPLYSERRKIRCRNEAVAKIEPPAIVVPKSAKEVASVVRWCIANGVHFAVRGGGNDYFGRTVVEGALVIDMREINFVHVAKDKQTATIGGGTVMKELIEKLDTEGLVTPVGNVWIVGYVGWATLGGYGPMQHSHGMGIEQIVGAEIVTAKGEVVSFGEEDERLEGLRGLGGNLGVITAVTIKVYPKIDILTGILIYESSDLAKTIRDYNEAVSKLEIPKPLTVNMFVMNLPALGGPHLMVFWTWADVDHETGKRYLGKFVAATPPVKINPVQTKTLAEHYATLPDHNTPWGGVRTQYFSEMMPALVETVVAALESIPNDPMCHLSWSADVHIDPKLKHCLGVGQSHVFFWSSSFTKDFKNKDIAETWNRDLFKAARKAGAPVMLDAAHPGLTPLGEKTLEQHLGAKAARGRELKSRYDPDNVFSLALPRFIS